MNCFRIFLVCITAMLFSSCGGGGSSTRSVTIGVLSSDTGALESFGPAIRASLTLAEQELNEQFSADGSPVSLRFVYEDTATDPSTALTKMSELHAQGITVFIGPMSSAELEAVRAYSQQHGLLVISPSSTSETLSLPDDLILRTTAPDVGQAIAVAAALQHFGTRFYCPIWRADDFGDDLTLMVGREFQSRGGNFAPGSRYALGTTDFSTALNQLEIQLDAYVDFFGSRSAAAYVISFDEVFEILAQANSRPPLLSQVRWYGSDGIALNPKVLANPAVAEFMRKSQLTSPIFAGDRSAPEFSRIRTELESTLGTVVRPYALMAYDAALLIAKAYDTLGDTEKTGVALKEAIITLSSTTVGATGLLSLDANGDRMPGEYEYWSIAQGVDGVLTWRLSGVLAVTGGTYSGAQFVPAQ